MSIITISRQLGTCGREIAVSIAERLDYRLMWREIINQAAVQSGVPEMALAVIDELDLFKLETSPEANQAYHETVRKIILTEAQQGKLIILGRGGMIILRDFPGSLHIRLVAPLDFRVQRLAAYQNIPEKAAMTQIKASDRYRKRYLKQAYGADWNDPDLYDLVINTSHFSIDQVCELIVQAQAMNTAVHTQSQGPPA